jgi:hypothetical protein
MSKHNEGAAFSSYEQFIPFKLIVKKVLGTRVACRTFYKKDTLSKLIVLYVVCSMGFKHVVFMM